MHLWLARTNKVPIREQLVTQIKLGILSGELAAGERLPSTRELARRFKVHANTVSAAFRELEELGWLESRHGSGVYVRTRNRSRVTAKTGQDRRAPTVEQHADALIAELFRAARARRIPMRALRGRLREWLAMQPLERFLLIEPDEGLRAILLHEIRAAVPFPCEAVELDRAQSSRVREGALPLALRSKVALVQNALPEGSDLVELQLRSVPQSLTPWLPSAAKRDLLIGVVSHWPEFLKQARTMLVAAGFDAGGLVLRDTRERNWKSGLRECNAVICDAYTAAAMNGVRTLAFPLLSDESIVELRELAKQLAAT